MNRVRGSSASPMKGHAGESGAFGSGFTMVRDHSAIRAFDLAPRTTDDARTLAAGAEMVRRCDRVARKRP